MDIPANLLPDSSLWIAAAVYVALLVTAGLTAPWDKLLDKEGSNIYFGAVAFIAVVWILRAGIEPGHNYHLLGATALCLMFGWQFALIAVSLVLVITTWQGPAGWETFAINALVMGAVPVLFTGIMLYACQRWLTHNFFIYVFINAFLTGALSMLLCGFAASAVLSMANDMPTGSYLQVIPLLMFGEAFLNGMLMILLVAYKPGWVATFHDHWYLDGK
ncbi:MAG: energy-coupling factor ABC transporter permease [Gammaproteobacteria bacterium]|jgi:uncharacterized membrane protein